METSLGSARSGSGYGLAKGILGRTMSSALHELHEAETKLLADLRALRRKQREISPDAKAAPQLTIGQRIADQVAATMGSWTFIIIQSALLFVWIVLNVTAFIQKWDPYPFILLNLALSFQAAYAAPFIMMSQNRQQDIDRKEAENDHQINIKAELEIELLHQKIDSLRENEVLMLTKTINDLTELLQRESKAAHEKRQADSAVKAPARAGSSRARKKTGADEG
jgi:uncharacterized membrane protein